MSFDSIYKPNMPRDGAYDVHHANYLYQQTEEYKQRTAYQYENINQLETIFAQTFPPGEAIDIPDEALGDPYDNNFHVVIARTLNMISNREHRGLPPGQREMGIGLLNDAYSHLEDQLKYIIHAFKSETDQSLKQEILKELAVAFTYPCLNRWNNSVNQSIQMIVATQNSI